jgi:hemerythrin superfamily protein
MPNPSTSTPGAGKTSASGAGGMDAVTLLKTDHREVEKLFSEFEGARDAGQKHQIADQIFLQLRIHTQIEEEIFYPTSREFLEDDEIIDESEAEHQSIKGMIKQIKGMTPADEMTFEAKVTALKEAVEHHVREEEEDLFPQVQGTDMDLDQTGQQLMTRKEELMAELSGGEASTQ